MTDPTARPATGDPSAPEPGSTLDLIYRQRACRAYRDDPVPDEDLVAIIKAASHAPSAENKQPWIFVVVDDASVRGQIDELTRMLWTTAGRAHSEVTLAPRFLADVDQFIGAGHGGAPCLIVVAADGRDGTGRATLAASVFPAIQNLLLAASALDYGSSMTTLAAQAPQELAAILGLPDRVTPMAVIPIGRRANAVGPPRRRPVDEIAHRNQFGAPFQHTDHLTAIARVRAPVTMRTLSPHRARSRRWRDGRHPWWHASIVP